MGMYERRKKKTRKPVAQFRIKEKRKQHEPSTLFLHLLSVHAVLLLLSRSHHLAQLIFLSEFTGEGTQVLDQIVACRDDGILWSDFTVGLNTKLELGDQRVRHLRKRMSIIQILAKGISIHRYIPCIQQKERAGSAEDGSEASCPECDPPC